MNLEELITLMSGAKDGDEPRASNTLSWEAYNLAKGLNDESLIGEIKTYLNKEVNADKRRYAYDLMGFIAKNTGDIRAIEVLLNSIEKEDGHTDNLHTILDAIYDSDIPLNTRVDKILGYAYDERDIIRNSAIQVLSNYTIAHNKIKIALLDIVEYHYDSYDLEYAISSLKKIVPENYKQLIAQKRAEIIKKGGDKEIINRIDNISENGF